MVKAKDMINEAIKYIGVVVGTSAHKKIIDKYNSVTPLPVGYKVKYTDDWCDTFISFLAIQTGATSLIGRECGVERHVQIFKQKGIWLEDGRITPKAGDIITFNWGTMVQQNDGFADHIGIVEKVVGNTIHTIEGNTSRMVSRRTYPVGWGYIRGYARPKYEADTPAKNPTNKNDFPVGSKVKILEKATHYQTGQKVNPTVKGETYTVQQRKEVNQSNSKYAFLLKEIISWVLAQDLEAVNGTTTYPERKVGQTVTVAKHATAYQTGQKIPTWVKGQKYKIKSVKTVKQSKSRRAYLLEGINSWFLEQDVE